MASSPGARSGRKSPLSPPPLPLPKVGTSPPLCLVASLGTLFVIHSLSGIIYIYLSLPFRRRAPEKNTLPISTFPSLLSNMQSPLVPFRFHETSNVHRPEPQPPGPVSASSCRERCCCPGSPPGVALGQSCSRLPPGPPTG